ncbi:hypothetical protein ABIE62_000167 [Porphyrobacter sp. MBR-155]|jgi:hypothetical protein|uniref:hypothetical protein n=1 Tax=Porphyrobacter sp. MBR-155 TaxID=3156464 RepID=UPI0033971D80
MTGPSLLDRLRGMNQRSLFGPGSGRRGLFSDEPGEGEGPAPASQTRAEAIQRLQVGLFGIGAMVLLVGLASIIGSQADLADEAAVPDAAPTTEPSPAPSQANPLADAGVVPDITLEPSPTPSPTPLDLPPPPRPSGSGNAAPSQ